MLGVLVLSLALSTPSAAAERAVAANDPLLRPSPQSALVQPGTTLINGQEKQWPFDAMEISPESDICYKIRAYIFSKGAHPKLLRETTCGPKQSAIKKIEGATPRLLPMDAKDKPVTPPER